MNSSDKINARIRELKASLDDARRKDEDDANSGSMYRFGGRVKQIQNEINKLRDLL